ncbi:hypothetical protein M9H77_13828 [Catharanthus roseus]|uniref:Uncharacterized protein n=1 Tax=Catharanthus roseus TaxID=4058 RepID=A0ACC0BLM7_CATRO|nr:hypothetical protein M9H77_13828 [Catharanthus roseus]
MGAYKDEILCDVVPMQACHLLLGRPWQFDRKSLHNGEKNTYSFVNDGRTFTMNPLTPQQVIEDYKDVFPDEMPGDLPPIRGIEHQIDFVPGAVLPNRPAYRSPPEGTKELKRQVEDLISKGYVEKLNGAAVRYSTYDKESFML